MKRVLVVAAAAVALCAAAPAAHAQQSITVGSVTLSPQCTPFGYVGVPAMPIVEWGTTPLEIWVAPGSAAATTIGIPGVTVTIPSQDIWANYCAAPPLPAPGPAPAPAPVPGPVPAPAQAPGPAPAPVVRPINCTQAWDMGVAPMRRGDAYYQPGLDRDGDGVACERTPR